MTSFEAGTHMFLLQMTFSTLSALQYIQIGISTSISCKSNTTLSKALACHIFRLWHFGQGCTNTICNQNSSVRSKHRNVSLNGLLKTTSNSWNRLVHSGGMLIKPVCFLQNTLNFICFLARCTLAIKIFPEEPQLFHFWEIQW